MTHVLSDSAHAAVGHAFDDRARRLQAETTRDSALLVEAAAMNPWTSRFRNLTTQMAVRKLNPALAIQLEEHARRAGDLYPQGTHA